MNVYSYEKWYLSGHSQGGAMIANYAEKHIEAKDTSIAGLILLAAYPTKNLAQSHNYSRGTMETDSR